MVVEVGANVGVYTRVFARAVGPTGTVHALEAFRRPFQFLTANVSGESARAPSYYSG